MKRLAFASTPLVVALAVSSCAVGVRQPATDITKTSATLNGKVLSTTGGPGSYFIEYGLTQARTERTPTREIDFTANTIYPVSEPVDGLEPGRRYHFAVCAEDSENPGDPFCSPDQTFATTGGDFVTSEGFETIDAHSGPSGEDPSGTIAFSSFQGTISCLTVKGNRASLGVNFDFGHFLLLVEDNEATGTPERRGFGDPVLPNNDVCPDPDTLSDRLSPTEGVDYVVHDEPPAPTAN